MGTSETIWPVNGIIQQVSDVFSGFFERYVAAARLSWEDPSTVRSAIRPESASHLRRWPAREPKRAGQECPLSGLVLVEQITPESHFVQLGKQEPRARK